jgi:hypothetical protein
VPFVVFALLIMQKCSEFGHGSIQVFGGARQDSGEILKSHAGKRSKSADLSEDKNLLI